MKNDKINEMEQFVLNYAGPLITEKLWHYHHSVTGLTGICVVDLLNRLVKKSPEDSLYLEVGTWRGKTLCGSSLEHDRLCIGVDSFCELEPHIREDVPRDLEANMATYGNNVKFYNEDCWEFFKSEEAKKIAGKVCTYFYDGAHDYLSQKRGVLEAVDILADDAIVVIDDVYMFPPETSTYDQLGPIYGTLDALKEDPRFSLIRKIRDPLGFYGFHYGLFILRFKRDQA